MSMLFLPLAIIGAVVVGDLVLENTATGAITVLNRPVTGYRDGLLLAMAGALGLVVGLLVVELMSLRRTRRVRRKQLRVAEGSCAAGCWSSSVRTPGWVRNRRAGGSRRASWSRSPQPPTLDDALGAREGAGLCRPTTRPSRPMRRPGGSLAAAPPTCCCCRPGIRPGPSRA
jgi:hypothetical protein